MQENAKVRRLMAENLIPNGQISVRENTFCGSKMHWHNYFEIELIVEGNAVHNYNGKSYTIGKGDAYIVTPVDFHEIQSQEPISRINICVHEAYLPEDFLIYISSPNAIKICKLQEDEETRFIAAANLLSYECNNGGKCTRQLLEYLLSFLYKEDPRKISIARSYGNLDGIRKAISYMDLHFRERLSLEKLASLSGYNPSYFSELFRKITGETYIERLKTLRINYAKVLLVNGQSVSNTCFTSGFGSLSNFLAAFKEKCGMTPSEYRKCHQNNQ